MAQRSLQGKSMFGQQTLSQRTSAPVYGFGSGTRSHAAKLFAGAEHAKTSSVSCTPGPCYESHSSLGGQSDGGKTSPPQWQFGTSDRFNGSPRKRTPGPGAYEYAGGIGKQSLSHRSTFPRYGFGTVDRETVGMAGKVFISPKHAESWHGKGSPGPAALYQRDSALAGPKYGFGTDERFNRLARELGDAAGLPGPGSYDDSGNFGPQHSSRLVTEPAFGFGSSNREHIAKVFVSDMHAKSSGGSFSSFSPGPNAYSPAPSIGIQATSRGRSAPSWGFGKSTRFKQGAYETGSPGPGAYAT